MQRGGRATHQARGMAIVVEQTRRLLVIAAISAAPGTSSEKKREGRALSRESGLCAKSCVICVTLCVIFFRGRIEGRRCAVWSGERGCARRGSRSVLWRGQGVPAGRERVLHWRLGSEEEGQTRGSCARRGTARRQSIRVRVLRFVNLQARERELCIVCVNSSCTYLYRKETLTIASPVVRSRPHATGQHSQHPSRHAYC